MLARFNAMVINFVQDGRQMHSGMTSVKAVLLTFAMLSALAVGGLGIYAADAASGHNAVDGYGVTTALD